MGLLMWLVLLPVPSCPRLLSSFSHVLMCCVPPLNPQDEGSERIWIRAEGEVEDLSLVSLCAMLREVDLYRAWIPMCTRSDVIRWKGRCARATIAALR
jgi:hypothetical protein